MQQLSVTCLGLWMNRLNLITMTIGPGSVSRYYPPSIQWGVVIEPMKPTISDTIQLSLDHKFTTIQHQGSISAKILLLVSFMLIKNNKLDRTLVKEL